MKEKNRLKPGRKPAEDPKEMIGVWVKKSIVKAVGGKELAKAAALDGIILEANKRQEVRQ